MRPIIEGALFRVLVCRPDLFDFHDLRNGRPKVLDPGEYQAAVKAALEAQGICALPEERGRTIAIKNTNEYSEQWRIATERGYVVRQYVATCIPPGW